MDSYGRDYYPKRVINPTPLAIRPLHDIRMQSLAIMPAKDDAQPKEIQDLQQKFKELSVQIANSKERRPRPTNQRTNIWCTNCGGHGHLPIECSTPIGNKNNLRCSYCKGKGHDVTTCWNLYDVRSVVASNNQWTEQAKNNYKINSKRSFTRPNVGPPYKPNDGRLRWNDTYNAPPNWNRPPTNPNTFRYGPLEKEKHIVCYRYGELGHYANNCSNPRKEEGYTPYCGRCRKPGHVAEECRAPQPTFPHSERDYSQEKQVQF
jgi:hypothetical protein